LEYIPPDGGGKVSTNFKTGKRICSSIESRRFHTFLGDPNQFDDVPLQNGGDTSWQVDLNNDLAYKRQNKPRSTKPQDFQVSLFEFSFEIIFFNHIFIDSNKNLSSTSIRWK